MSDEDDFDSNFDVDVIKNRINNIRIKENQKSHIIKNDFECNKKEFKKLFYKFCYQIIEEIIIIDELEPIFPEKLYVIKTNKDLDKLYEDTQYGVSFNYYKTGSCVCNIIEEFRSVIINYFTGNGITMYATDNKLYMDYIDGLSERINRSVKKKFSEFKYEIKIVNKVFMKLRYNFKYCFAIGVYPKENNVIDYYTPYKSANYFKRHFTKIKPNCYKKPKFVII